jgi:hypothetical protein
VRSNRRFLFGDKVSVSLGTCIVEVLTPGGVLELSVDVVDIDVPFPFGLDVMDKHRLQVLTMSNELESVPSSYSLGWRMAVVRKGGHVCLKFRPPSKVVRAFYSEVQLRKMHRNLFHPSSRKLYELLKRADPNNLPRETLQMLEDIAKACHTCMKTSNAPRRFTVRFPDEVIFNRMVFMDLMFIEDRRPVLHVEDAGTIFQAAIWLTGEDVASVWNGLFYAGADFS